MPRTQRKRRFLRVIAAALLALVLLIAAVPLWFPWLLRPSAGRFGVRYTQYERVGYARFELRGVTFTNRAGTFRAQQVSAFVPTVWVGRLSFRNTREAGDFLEASGWSWEVAAPAKRAERPRTSVYTNWVRTDRVFSLMRSWLPGASLSNGAVRVEGRTVTIPSAGWRDGSLSAQFEVPEIEQSATLTADLKHRPYELVLESPTFTLRSAAEIVEANGGLEIRSTNLWRGNRVEVSARYGRTGRLPETATLVADAFRLPSELLKIPRYQEVTGSVTARWDGDQFAGDVVAAAQPLAGSPPNLPALGLDIRARGDTASALIEQAEIVAPGLRAALSQGVRVSFTGPLLRNRAALRVAVDFSQQPWLALRGQLRGSAFLNPGPDKYPAADFSLTGTNIAGFEVNADSLDVEGSFVWPRLDVTRAKVGFADGSAAELAGQVDLRQRTIRDGRLQFAGPFGRQFLPAGCSYAALSLSGTFSGPWSRLEHAGRLRAENFTAPRLKPVGLEGEWMGEGQALRQVQWIATAGDSALEFHGELALTAAGIDLLIRELTLRKEGAPVLELEQPCQLAFGKAAGRQGNGRDRASARLAPLRWLGAERELALEGTLHWPTQGRVSAAARALPLSLFRGFVEAPTNQIEIERLELAADWDNGPVNSTVELAAAFQPEPAFPFSGTLALRTNGEEMEVEKLTLLSGNEPVATARGALPLTFVPGASEVVRIDPGKTLSVTAATQPNPGFWERMAEWTGLAWTEPVARVEVAGTWGAPQARVTAQAAQLAFPRIEHKLPAIERLQLTAEVNEDLARVGDFQALVEQQPVRVTGEIPLGPAFWKSLTSPPDAVAKGAPVWPDWRNATARLTINEAEIAPFAPFVPGILSPQGRLNLELALARGGVSGELTVEDVRTRPLGGLGPIRDIDARVKLVDSRAQVEALRGVVAGEPVRVTGQFDLRELQWPVREFPPFELTLRGSNVPLARSLQLIMRADLDLSVSNSPTEPPLISGTIALRDSFFLRELDDLISGKVARAPRRPPYFSVPVEPFADWKLGVAVGGQKFMKIQSPFFRGLISADLDLRGNLKDPVALGVIKVNSGAVTFPFGRLTIKEGYVSLTSEDPYQPQLSINAEALRLGYDIRMELSGSVNEPMLAFSSIPPLPSEKILLMLMTGEVPKEAINASTRNRIGGVALFLGRGLLGQLGFGLGGEERLTIRSGEYVSETGRPTLYVEYQLTDDWSMIGEYDRFNEFNAGVKWRIYSR